MEALLDLLFQDRGPFAFCPILDPTQDFRIEVWLGVGMFKLQTCAATGLKFEGFESW
jgi:hypothetical protein